MMEIKQTWLPIGMDLNGTRDEFWAGLNEPRPHLESLEQLIEDFRDTLDIFDSQAQLLHRMLHRMEEKLDATELAAT